MEQQTMNTFKNQIRLFKPKDIETMLEIYQYYVENTAISFEYQSPSLEEFRNRIETITKDFPCIVYEENGVILGYAYASKFKERMAYQWTTESTIYLKHDYLSKGIGRKLYSILFQILRLQGYYNVFAGITMPNPKSEYLHKNMGFNEIGTYQNVGFKSDKWHSVMWLSLDLQVIDNQTENIVPTVPKNINELVGTAEYNEIMYRED